MQFAIEYPTGTFPNELKIQPQFELPSISREIKILGLLLACIQILDGLFTGIGVAHWGISMEGNALIRMLMHSLGYIPALILVKTIAIAVVATLCLLSVRISWVSRALKSVIAIYLVAAIVPWATILILKLA